MTFFTSDGQYYVRSRQIGVEGPYSASTKPPHADGDEHEGETPGRPCTDLRPEDAFGPHRLGLFEHGEHVGSGGLDLLEAIDGERTVGMREQR